MFSNADWLKWQEIWTDNPLINLDVDEIESVITGIHDTMSRCVREFQEHPSRLIFRLDFTEFQIYYM